MTDTLRQKLRKELQLFANSMQVDPHNHIELTDVTDHDVDNFMDYLKSLIEGEK